MAETLNESPATLIEDPPHIPLTGDGQPNPSIEGSASSKPLNYRFGTLELIHAAVFKDLGPISIVRNSVFDNFLPPQHPAAEPSAIEDKINETNELLGWEHWSAAPAKINAAENEMFMALSKLIDDIIKATQAVTGCVPTVDHVHNPSSTPLPRRTNSSQPDGYFALKPNIDPSTNTVQPCRPYAMLKHAQDGVDPLCPCGYWEDIASPFEYRKINNDDTREENEHKVIWSLYHIMRNDPCRRFAFGITVENTYIRVWLSHRAGMVVSKGFDFMKDRHQFIRLISSLAFASPADLGWDPTVVAQLDGEKIAHKITVRNSLGYSEDYLTTEIISDLGAQAVRGRGTRVWAARKLVNGQPGNDTVVIKDSWIDHDRKREGDVMADMMSELREMEDVDMEDVEKHFLTIVLHGDVYVDGANDTTLGKIMRGTDIPRHSHKLYVRPPEQITFSPSTKGSSQSVKSDLLSTESASGSIRTTSQSNLGTGQVDVMTTSSVDPSETMSTDEDEPSPNRTMHHRQHYRIVFKERGESLHRLHDLRDRLKAILGATKALAYMWKCNMIHRDISIGNILFVNGEGVLVDFEYAQPFPPTTLNVPSDVRTGTSHLMAIEIAIECYHFTPVVVYPREEVDRMRIEKKPGKKRPLLHNPLHDVESIWWTALWAIASLTLKEADTNFKPTTYLKTYVRMFPGTFGHLSRLGFINGQGLSEIIPVSFQYELWEPMYRLEALRVDLVQWYRTAYAPFTSTRAEVDKEPFGTCHEGVKRHLELILSAVDSLYLPDTEITLVSLQEALDDFKNNTPQLPGLP